MISARTATVFPIMSLVCCWGCSTRPKAPPRQMSQSLSPMTGASRTHEHIENTEVLGISIVVNNALVYQNDFRDEAAFGIPEPSHLSWP